VYQRKAIYDELAKRRKRILENRKEINGKLDMLEQVRLLLQQASEFAREQARQQIEYMVTRALQYTFGPEMSFQIEISEKRGQPDAEFYVISDYDGITVRNKPQDARGGGVVDIISIALRVALLETTQPRIDAPLLLDEPGKHVSNEFAPNMGQFLKSVSRNFGRQILLVSHNQYLTESADMVYCVDIKEGKSSVTRMYTDI